MRARLARHGHNHSNDQQHKSHYHHSHNNINIHPTTPTTIHYSNLNSTQNNHADTTNTATTIPLITSQQLQPAQNKTLQPHKHTINLKSPTTTQQQPHNNPTTTSQQTYNNLTTTPQQPHNNPTTTSQQP